MLPTFRINFFNKLIEVILMFSRLLQQFSYLNTVLIIFFLSLENDFFSFINMFYNILLKSET